jgi:hypothetical protein
MLTPKRKLYYLRKKIDKVAPLWIVGLGCLLLIILIILEVTK